MALHPLFLVFLAGLVSLSEAAPQGSSDSKHPLFIKVLDSARGSPAPNLLVKLHKEVEDGSWELLNSKLTNENGEIQDLIPKDKFEGKYKIEFDTDSYWRNLGLNPFYQYADVVFTANDAGLRHYSIINIISPFSYSTAATVSEPME
ncbi:transthyretin-like [Coturnix japonica]|uniref:transthyretin-like n=1 Tax=Coturnix japonica TaxID=93934 RepID=UPI000776F0C3|nr:transthyretin-like [Coturnix japonica]